MKKNAIVISGFPGIGKSHYYREMSGAAQSTIEKHAKPFDPRQVLRQSDNSLPFPEQQKEKL